MSDDRKRVVFEFETEEQAMAFVSWMCNQGEQDYWESIDCGCDAEHKVTFDYWVLNGKKFGLNVKCAKYE
jgi:hypothetical protein